nr:T9SS type A sorting domain-containing protein [Flavobacterium sp. ASV13]
MKIKLLLLTLLFFVKFGFAQNYVTYSAKSATITTNSGVEGSIDIIISCYGNSSNPVILEQHFLCGDPDGFLSNLASNGLMLSPGQSTTLKFKFKKTVTADTQKIYKFTTNGSCFQNESEMIKITVNFKGGTTTPPTDPTTPTNPTTPGNINTVTNSNPMYVEDGATMDLIVGSDMGSNVTYQWYRNEADGTGDKKIIGATGKDYRPEINNGKGFANENDKYNSTIYYRHASDPHLSISNAILQWVVRAPKIENNAISVSGSEVQGSIPTAGTGSYSYRWYVYVLEGEDPWLFEQNTKDFTVPESVYSFMGSNNVYVTREVRSGSRISTSNGVVVTPAQEISNNIISLSGSNAAGFNITGSNPTGGTGTFRYEYYAYNEFDGEVIGDVQKIGTNRDYYQSSIGGLSLKFYRKVYSGNKVSSSNTVTILPGGSFAKMASTNILEITSANLAVYPNPTSESVNFATNFSVNKEIEIVVYSERLQNEKSVYKGIATPNQVINWNIPATYPKGLYFYKILSDSKEVKTGKIIVQ